MAVEDKNISYRIYLVAFAMFVMACAIVVKLAKERTVKNFKIEANKGNIYSADGSLLATSIPNYEIRFDAVVPKTELFQRSVDSLADSLAYLLGKPSHFYENELRKARAKKNRYFLIARNLSYTDYVKIKGFPLFKAGANKGGIIVAQKTVREYPIGKIAERTIGYERVKPDGTPDGKGIEWAYRKYLNGKDGKILKQKIAKGQWKPIRDLNEVDPIDGYDVISTIDVFIQDIAHHALLKQLEEYDAEHGCVVVMETKTGRIKAISNLGKATDGSYYETQNYAITEAHDPGSTFKLVDLMAVLEDKVADTSTVFDANGGIIRIHGKPVEDSHHGLGKVSLAHGFEVSSNTIMVQSVYNNYKNNPSKFIKHIEDWGLDKKIGLELKGEATPKIPKPGEAGWSALSLPWMAFGYGINVTPMQTLTYYNSVANNGVMVKPQLVSEIKKWNSTIKKIEPQVINPKVCSPETLKKIRVVLENVVRRGTAKSLYTKEFPMAGKTGTAQMNYGNKSGSGMYYASSFVGYFPANKPQYTCIVVVHKPNTAHNNYYGADVAGPVFKRIAQKIFTDAPSTNEIRKIDRKIPKQELDYAAYYNQSQNKQNVIPDVKGMSGMDAIALLENLGIRVKIKGFGKVKKQSLQAGQNIAKNTTIVLELS
jgi:cell division protein FtsI (penicillin-binding protein 3)